jgi:hypothetical protein
MQGMELTYHYDARAETVECTNAGQCPTCASPWRGIRGSDESPAASPVADCIEGHTFQVKTIHTTIGKPVTFTIGDAVADGDA